MARVSGAKFGNELAAFLGVPIDGHYVFRLEVDCPVDAAATVTVHRFVDLLDTRTIATRYFINEDEGEVIADEPVEPQNGFIEVTAFDHDTKLYRQAG